MCFVIQTIGNICQLLPRKKPPIFSVVFQKDVGEVGRLFVGGFIVVRMVSFSSFFTDPASEVLCESFALFGQFNIGGS